MNRTAYTLMSFCLLLAGAGCPKKTLPPGVVVADKQVALAAMKPTDVIVSVNGQGLTRKAFEDRLELDMTLYALRSPSVNQQKQEAYRNSRRSKIILEYVPRQLILQEGRRLGIRLPPEALAAAERKVWQHSRPNTADEDFAAALGPLVPVFKQHVADDEYIRVTRETVFGERLAVSEEDVDAAMKRRMDWNEVYAETNRLVMARGEAIVSELRAGADFAEMAKKVSQHRPEDGREWGEFTRDEIEDPKLRAIAFELPVGAISDPLDTEGGLLIIRVLDRTEGGEINSPLALRPAATVKLAKILLYLYNPCEAISREDLRAELEKGRITAIQKEWMPKLHEAARVEYPNGTNLWPRVQQSLRRGGQSS